MLASSKRLISALCVASLGLGVMANSASAQEYKPLKRLGGAQTICKPPIHSRQDLVDFANNQGTDIVNILNFANWSGNAADLVAQIRSGNFIEKSYPAGTRLEWMGARNLNTGVAEAVFYREWAGKEPFQGFELEVISNCQLHTIVIPKDCCNVALASSQPIQLNAPSVSKTLNGTSLTVSSSDASRVMLQKPDGSTEELALSNGTWVGELAPGDHSLYGITENDCERVESARDNFNVAEVVAAVPAVAAVGLDDQGRKGFFIAPYIGFENKFRLEVAWQEHREDNSPIVGLRGGYIGEINKKWSWLAQLGVIERTDLDPGTIYPETDYSFDLGIERNIGESGFIGGGVGIWNFSDDVENEGSLFIHGGSDLYKGAHVTTQWFIEGRIFEEPDAQVSVDLKDNHAVITGLRFRF